MVDDWAELQRRTQENLVTFLRIEVELASTFKRMAKTTDDPERRAKLRGDAQKAVSAIRHFAERTTDKSIRAELNRAANKLDRRMGAATP
jgi:hypothetical protein